MANELEDNINALTKNLPPLSVQSSQDIRNISPYLRYAHDLEVSDAKSVYAQKGKFIPYNTNELYPPLGAYWFLLSFNPIRDESVSAAFLDIGDHLPKNSKIMILPRKAKEWQLVEDVYTRQKFHQEIVEDTELKKIESNINLFSSGLYDLTPLRHGGELLIYSPGLPGLWFSPSLVKPASAPITLDRQITPILLLTLFALMFFSLWRGMREEGDARLWAAVLTFCALVQYSFGVAENPEGKVEVWSLVGIVCASLSIFLLPHIGRHYMVTEKNSPNLDGFFQFLAIPAIFPLAVFFTPLPQYYPILYYAPLWGLYAFLPCFFTIIPALIGKKGAKFYFFFSLCVGLGALIGLLFRENPIFSLAPQAGLCVAMFAMFLAPRQSEKNIIEKKDDEHADPIRDFAEHNMYVREVFFRVEAKLREPFDRIMREACYLDVGTKSDEISDAIKILQEQNGEQGEVLNHQAVQNISDKTNKLQAHTDALVHACKDLSGLLRNMPKLAQKATPYQSSHELFNLKNLVLHACDAIRQEAQDKQIGLGWYIAPQMGLFYRGDKNKLNEVLGLLLRDAVRATTKGMISVRVRRANNPNPGHIVFTISDSGKGRPPVERSPLTLIKAWELSTQHSGEVELHSSPNGLSFSFSLECIAMDASGEKPVPFANLDEIVVRKKQGVQGSKTQAEGASGGNLVFTRTQDNTPTAKQQKTEDRNNVSQKENSQIPPSGLSSQAVPDAVNDGMRKSQEVSAPLSNTAKSTAHASDSIGTAQSTKIASLENHGDNQDTEKKENILLICPPAIQRQNIAWYINQYEIWEALDVDSALACYEAKPSKLVLVHSSLSANGCSAVIAGIRLLENSLGLNHTTFLGLYQSAKDMEFLRLAGCKHVLPGNIGREGLGMTVAEILQDPFLAPIEDIETGHLVLKKDVQLAQKIQEEAKLAVEKCLNTKREFAGTVDDTLCPDFGNQETVTENKSPSTEQKTQTEPETQAEAENITTHKNTPLSMEATTSVSGEEESSLQESSQADEAEQSTAQGLNLNMPTARNESVNKLHKKQTSYPINPIDEEEFIQSEEQVLAHKKAKEEANKLEHVGTVDDTLPQAHFYAQAQQNAKKSLMSKLFGFMKPKPTTSLRHDETSYVDDFVGEPTPIITNALKAQAHLQKTIIEEEIEEQKLEELYSDTFDTNFDDEFVGEPADISAEVPPEISTQVLIEASPEISTEISTEALEDSSSEIFAKTVVEIFAETAPNISAEEDSKELITDLVENSALHSSQQTENIFETESEVDISEVTTFDTATTSTVDAVDATIDTIDTIDETEADTVDAENTENETEAETVTIIDTINEDETIDAADAMDEVETETDIKPEADILIEEVEEIEVPNETANSKEITEELTEEVAKEITEEAEEVLQVEHNENYPQKESIEEVLTIDDETSPPETEPMETEVDEAVLPETKPMKAESIETETDEAEAFPIQEPDNNEFMDENSQNEERTDQKAINENLPYEDIIDEGLSQTEPHNGESDTRDLLYHEEKTMKVDNAENPLQDLLPFSSKFITQQGYIKEDDLPRALFIQKGENNLLKHDFSDDFLSFDPEIQTDIKEIKPTLTTDLHEPKATVLPVEQTENLVSSSQNTEQDYTVPLQDDFEVMQLTEDMLLQQKTAKEDNKSIELELDLTPQNGGKNKKEKHQKLELLWDNPHTLSEQKSNLENKEVKEENDPLLFFPENKN